MNIAQQIQQLVAENEKLQKQLDLKIATLKGAHDEAYEQQIRQLQAKLNKEKEKFNCERRDNVVMRSKLAEYNQTIEQLQVELEIAKKQPEWLYYNNIYLTPKEISALLDKLNSELAEAKEQNRWIPVSERLPEKDALYMAYAETADPDKLFYGTAWYDPNRFGWSIFPKHLIDSITHWKPITLPEQALKDKE